MRSDSTMDGGEDDKNAINAVIEQFPRFISCPETYCMSRLRYAGGERIVLIFADKNKEFVFPLPLEWCMEIGKGLLDFCRWRSDD